MGGPGVRGVSFARFLRPVGTDLRSTGVHLHKAAMRLDARVLPCEAAAAPWVGCQETDVRRCDVRQGEGGGVDVQLERPVGCPVEQKVKVHQNPTSIEFNILEDSHCRK
jgi:hypothetical protein